MKKYVTSCIALVALILLAGLTGCSKQSMAKSFGGTATVDLPPHTKLITATWKEDQLWYLTRPMKEGEEAETLTLHESSSFGLVQGKVIFRESKQP